MHIIHPYPQSGYLDMKKISFKKINDEDEFWCGAIFKKEGTHLNNPAPEEDYYEYMLLLDLSNPEWMLCAQTDKWEKGHIVSHIKMSKENARLTVKAKDFKKSMVMPGEIDSWYFIDEGIRNTRIKFEELITKHPGKTKGNKKKKERKEI